MPRTVAEGVDLAVIAFVAVEESIVMTAGVDFEVVEIVGADVGPAGARIWVSRETTCVSSSSLFDETSFGNRQYRTQT